MKQAIIVVILTLLLNSSILSKSKKELRKHSGCIDKLEKSIKLHSFDNYNFKSKIVKINELIEIIEENDNGFYEKYDFIRTITIDTCIGIIQDELTGFGNLFYSYKFEVNKELNRFESLVFKVNKNFKGLRNEEIRFKYLYLDDDVIVPYKIKQENTSVGNEITHYISHKESLNERIIKGDTIIDIELKKLFSSQNLDSINISMKLVNQSKYNNQKTLSLWFQERFDEDGEYQNKINKSSSGSDIKFSNLFYTYILHLENIGLDYLKELLYEKEMGTTITNTYCKKLDKFGNCIFENIESKLTYKSNNQIDSKKILKVKVNRTIQNMKK